MEMKFCHACTTTKAIGDFRKSSRHKDGLQTQCKKCADVASESWRQRNLEKRAVQQTALRKSNQERFRVWKEQHQCIKCGEGDPSCLELHHTDPSTKEDAVSNMVCRGFSWENILVEISKCVVLCSNCHKKYHAGRFVL